MDFGKLDLRTTAEQEYWVHLRLGDKFLYADMEKQEGPCRAKVASVSAPNVKDALRSVLRGSDQMERVSNLIALEANDTKRAALESRLVTLEREAEATFERFLLVLIRDWENITLDDKPLKFSQEALADYAKPGAPFYRLVSEIAQDVSKAQNPFTKAATA